MFQAVSIARGAAQRLASSLLLGAAALTIACGSNDKQTPAADQGAAPAAASGPSNAKVTDLRIGKKMDASKQVSAQTDIFAANDTIFAAVHTVGASPNTEIIARWTSQDGKVVDEQKQQVTPPADAWNGFQLAKAGGTAPGTYTLHVLLNGQETQKRDVVVK